MTNDKCCAHHDESHEILKEIEYIRRQNLLAINPASNTDLTLFDIFNGQITQKASNTGQDFFSFHCLTKNKADTNRNFHTERNCHKYETKTKVAKFASSKSKVYKTFMIVFNAVNTSCIFFNLLHLKVI